MSNSASCLCFNIRFCTKHLSRISGPSRMNREGFSLHILETHAFPLAAQSSVGLNAIRHPPVSSRVGGGAEHFIAHFSFCGSGAAIQSTKMSARISLRHLHPGQGRILSKFSIRGAHPACSCRRQLDVRLDRPLPYAQRNFLISNTCLRLSMKYTLLPSL